MDPSISFNMFNINKAFSAKEFLRTINQGISERFGPKVKFRISSEKGFATNAEELCCSVQNPGYLEKLTKSLFRADLNYHIRSLSVRIKILRKNIDSDFTVIPKTEVICQTKKKHDPSNCLSKPEGCLLKKSTYMKRHEVRLSKLICPACIEEILADSVLKDFSSTFTQAFNKSGVQCNLKQEYRPG